MKKATLLLSFLLLLMTSCATKISDVSIARIGTSIHDLSGNAVQQLLPGQIYRIQVEIIDDHGKSHANPNYEELVVDRFQNMRIIRQAPMNLIVATEKQSFFPAGSPPYGFRMAVKENPYPPQVYTYAIDWAHYDTLDFRGAPGAKGQNGTTGRSATGTASTDVKGGPGGNAHDGLPGDNAKDLQLVVATYHYGDSDKLLFYNRATGGLYLTDVKHIIIDGSGGAGGAGGKGGDGGQGRDYTDSYSGMKTSGSSGPSGNGGRGGAGGKGANATVYASDKQLFDLLEVRVDGGAGGRGGEAGQVPFGGGGATRGMNGMPGPEGASGTLQLVAVSPDELKQMLDQVDAAGFDMKDVAY